jgi:hypothetical protein
MSKRSRVKLRADFLTRIHRLDTYASADEAVGFGMLQKACVNSTYSAKLPKLQAHPTIAYRRKC